MPLDAFGNPITQAELDAKKKLDDERAAAKARREAKAAAKAETSVAEVSYHPTTAGRYALDSRIRGWCRRMRSRKRPTPRLSLPYGPSKLQE